MKNPITHLMEKKGAGIRWLCLLALLCCSLGTYAQVSKQVTVRLKHATIRDVFAEIKKQADVGFMYSNAAVGSLPAKDYDMVNVPVTKVIAYCLEGSELTYEVEGKKTIIIKRRAVSRQASGCVVDAEGEPLPGASVLVRGTRTGVITDVHGRFTLTLPDANDAWLVISYIGMKQQEVAWKGRPLNVMLEDESKILDEVVVTGYQVISKRELTSAITSVKAEDIIRPDAMSIDQMLEGQIPDMMFMSNSGEAGVVPKIRIRGTSSIIGNREPLWVVDGIIVQDPVQISPEELNDPDYINRIGNAIAGLNPQDIERLDVLKDASATALYGTKAANGVIVITTKRGREGKPEVRYSNTFNFKRRPRYTDRSVDVMDSKERIQFSRELFESGYEYSSNIAMVGYEGLLNDLYNKRITDAEFLTSVSRLETVNTDWFDLLTHNSFSQQHTLSISGGSERGRYYASVGLNDTDDIVKGTKNKRYTAMLNLDSNLAKWLTASFSLKGNVSERDYYQESLSPINYAYKTSRAIPAYTDSGEYYYYKKMVNYNDGYKYNILNELNNSSVEQEGSSVALDANFRFRFTDWLTANAIGSYTSQTTDINGYWGDKTYYAARLRGCDYGEMPTSQSLMPQGSELSTQRFRQNSYTVRLQLDWNKYWDDETHNFSGSLGYEMGSTRYKGYAATARGYYPDRGLSFVNDIDPDAYPSYKSWLAGNVPSLTDDLSNYISAYLSLSYGYRHMLYLNANARIDGSNKFGDRSNDKILPIWSVSASFDFSKLALFKQLSWLDYLTLKTSYGFQGNMLSSESPVMIIQKNPMSDYYHEYTATGIRNPNPNLKWERTNSYNIGVEIGLFNNRLNVEGEVYFKRTKDAFMSKSISTVNGMSSYVVNGGNISNDGFSVNLTATPVRYKDWTWTLATSFSRTINKITTSPAGESYELSDFLNGTAVVKGKSIGTFYSYKFLGLSPVNGGPLFDDWEDHYEDLVGLSKYDTYTRVLEASGTREPFMSGNLTTMLRWRNIRLNANFAYSLGAKTRLFGMYGHAAYDAASDTYSNYGGEIRPDQNISRDYMDRWKKPGDELHTDIPAIIPRSHEDYLKYQNHWSNSLQDEAVQTLADNYWDMYDYSNRRVVSANYLKLYNVSLTYEIPRMWLKRYGLNKLEVTLSGSNLFTICDSALKGQTPTQGGFTNIQLSDRPGFSFGLNLTF